MVYLLRVDFGWFWVLVIVLRVWIVAYVVLLVFSCGLDSLLC